MIIELQKLEIVEKGIPFKLLLGGKWFLDPEDGELCQKHGPFVPCFGEKANAVRLDSNGSYSRTYKDETLVIPITVVKPIVYVED